MLNNWQNGRDVEIRLDLNEGIQRANAGYLAKGANQHQTTFATVLQRLRDGPTG